MTKKETLLLAKKEHGKFVARGKKTIDELADLARRNGHEKIFIIEEKESKPFKIGIIRVDELGRWSWEEERLLKSSENYSHESKVQDGG